MKTFIGFIAIVLGLCLTACQTNSTGRESRITEQNETGSNRIRLSNMSAKADVAEVESALKKALPEENVAHFIQTVGDYNETIENHSLVAGFKEVEQPAYDMGKIAMLWAEKKGGFIGTNCRINTFLLLKDNISMPKKETADDLLFLDKDAIDVGAIFNERDKERFLQLFSKVKTENTKDVSVHAKKMEEFFADVEFDGEAGMISVVIHDRLDGDHLFIGHVGVLTEQQDGQFLFLEKLSFEEPYQAIRFSDKEECFSYLLNKYKDYQDEDSAKPFLMENGSYVRS